MSASIAGANLDGMRPGLPIQRYVPNLVTVLVVDDHPALRAGLEGLLGQESDLVSLGAVRDEEGVTAALAEARADVVILDYALNRGDGLSVCFRIKQLPHPPRVVIYSAYADRVFAVPATLAQADGLASKSAPVDELLGVVRTVASGELSMPPLDSEAMTAVSSRLGAHDLPVAGMLFARVDVDEIANTLGVLPSEVRSRALRIIGALQHRERSDGRRRAEATEPILG